MRLRKKSWIAEAIKDFAPVLPNPFNGEWRKPLKAGPIHMEIGTGRGIFINTLAAVNSNINYIGLEAQRDVVFFAAQKAVAHSLQNLMFFLCNATEIDNIFSPGEINRLYINFCDPWPKNRHAKRRLTHNNFLKKYGQILSPGGELHFKTDNEKLFEFSLNEFVNFGLKLRNITFDLHALDEGNNIMTEYEKRFSAKGMKIYGCEAVF